MAKTLEVPIDLDTAAALFKAKNLIQQLERVGKAGQSTAHEGVEAMRGLANAMGIPLTNAGLIVAGFQAMQKGIAAVREEMARLEAMRQQFAGSVPQMIVQMGFGKDYRAAMDFLAGKDSEMVKAGLTPQQGAQVMASIKGANRGLDYEMTAVYAQLAAQAAQRTATDPVAIGRIMGQLSEAYPEVYGKKDLNAIKALARLSFFVSTKGTQAAGERAVASLKQASALDIGAPDVGLRLLTASLDATGRTSAMENIIEATQRAKPDKPLTPKARAYYRMTPRERLQALTTDPDFIAPTEEGRRLRDLTGLSDRSITTLQQFRGGAGDLQKMADEAYIAVRGEVWKSPEYDPQAMLNWLRAGSGAKALREGGRSSGFRRAVLKEAAPLALSGTALGIYKSLQVVTDHIPGSDIAEDIFLGPMQTSGQGGGETNINITHQGVVYNSTPQENGANNETRRGG